MAKVLLSPKILLLGVGGQVGRELRRSLCLLGEVNARDRKGLDITDSIGVARLVREYAPDVIVNAAAYTAVDRAESERELCMSVNGVAPGVIAEEGVRLGAWIVHYSTDYVFSGQSGRPWLETDEPCPINFYGESKLVGDRAVARAPKHLILRTSWVCSPRGRNFLLTMLRLAAERRELKVVDDQRGAPTFARQIAEATATALRRLLSGGGNELAGTYNITSTGETTWHGFAEAIMEYAGLSQSVKIIPIGTAEYGAPAPRPPYSLLSTEKIRSTFGINPPSWQEATRLCLDEVQDLGAPPHKR